MKTAKEVADDFEKKPAGKLFPGAANTIRQGFCPTCQKPIGKFKDKTSEREFEISGMCQECQDKVFGGDEDG